ncbi:LptF/LptG family permease [Candidatus Pelagibacter sp.]|nr:LptF/LptG family permease [Candidatus Pelagibacter sp.]
MNKLIFRKLSYDIFGFFLLSSIAITSIVWVIQGVNLLDIVSEQGHGIKVYFFYTALNIPKIFSKLLIFTYFLTLFVVLGRYLDNNEILVFWTNGIKKISFINFIGRLSVVFVIIQLILNLYIVPYTQKLKQEYLKNSSLNLFPKLIQEKKFINITKRMTIFVEENKSNGILQGIYIKEKLNESESKIITARNGKLFKNNEGFSFKLLDGKITNIDKKGSINLNFKETTYELSKLDSNIRQTNKINETNSLLLFLCLEKFLKERKNDEIRCSRENSFLINEIYEEMFQRTINPIYIIILSLISSLMVVKPKKNLIEENLRVILFFIGFLLILFSQLSYKFITSSFLMETIFICLPFIFIIIFYLTLIIKTKLKLKYL